MRRTPIAALALAAVIAGCSGGDDDSAGSTTITTERPTTTTTEAPTPDEAFLDDMATELEFGEADGPQAMLDLAQATCDALDTADGVATDDAANDSAESDAAISEVSATMALTTAFSGDLDEQVVAIVLTNGGEHLCPEHADQIADYIEREGIQLPGG